MKRAWVLWLCLVWPVWADDRQLVGKIFSRPEFLWKSEEKQPPPPACEVPRFFEDEGGGLPDRSGLVKAKAESNGLIAPEGTDEPADTSTPSDSEHANATGTPTPSASGTPEALDQGEDNADTPIPSSTVTPGSSDQGQASGTPTPSDTGTAEPSDQGKATSTPGAASPTETPAATPDLPDHGPPPLDYPVEPGRLERFARWWNGLFGHQAKDGMRHILLLLRDLVALLLLAVFLRHLIPVLRQMRNWFKTEKPAAVLLGENSPEPEILPEWRQLWSQAAELQRQGRPDLGQRMSYLAVLAFLDHGGHIRYRPSATNREYVFNLENPLRDSFAGITRSFERCRYGGQAPDFETFQAACREVLPL